MIVFPEPSSKVTVPGVMFPTCTVSVCSMALNPVASMRTTYSPGTNGPELYVPALVTSVVTFAPVPLLVMVTLAPPTVAPFGSKIVP